MEIIFSDLQRHWEGCRARLRKRVTTGEAKWLERMLSHTRKPVWCCLSTLGVQLCVATMCTLPRTLLDAVGLTATITFHVNGFTTPLFSPDTTFQLRVQDVLISLGEGPVVCLHPVCKNIWLADSVPFVASVVEDKTRNFPGYRKRAQRLTRC